MTTWSFLEQANVEIACTDDPADDLAEHASIAASALKTWVIPAYRPDSAMAVNDAGFAAYLQKLGACVGAPIDRFSALIEALIQFDYFIAGARISDHAIDVPLAETVPPIEIAERPFSKRLSKTLSTGGNRQYHARVMLDHRWGRFGVPSGNGRCACISVPSRNVNSHVEQDRPGDRGFDSIADYSYSAVGFAGPAR